MKVQEDPHCYNLGTLDFYQLPSFLLTSRHLKQIVNPLLKPDKLLKHVRIVSNSVSYFEFWFSPTRTKAFSSIQNCNSRIFVFIKFNKCMVQLILDYSVYAVSFFTSCRLNDPIGHFKSNIDFWKLSDLSWNCLPNNLVWIDSPWNLLWCLDFVVVGDSSQKCLMTNLMRWMWKRTFGSCYDKTCFAFPYGSRHFSKHTSKNCLNTSSVQIPSSQVNDLSLLIHFTKITNKRLVTQISKCSNSKT